MSGQDGPQRKHPRPPWPALLRAAPGVVCLLVRLRRLHRRLDMDALVAAVTPPATGPPRTDARAAAYLARALAHRLPRLFPQPCLYASLAGYHFLLLAGEDVVIRVGVRTEEGRLLSHAWLEVDGQPCFDDPPLKGFVEMVAYPRR